MKIQKRIIKILNQNFYVLATYEEKKSSAIYAYVGKCVIYTITENGHLENLVEQKAFDMTLNANVEKSVIDFVIDRYGYNFMVDYVLWR